ncbi:DUF3293 domain-containing protein [bacterium]|nr:DUF3293 domain-containing protein [bacterium]
MTAYNPGSQRLEPAKNARRNARLQFYLQRCAAHTLLACNIADSGDWPDEPGWLILGSEHATAARIATVAGQAAWVAYALGQAPSLQWTRHAPSD